MAAFLHHDLYDGTGWEQITKGLAVWPSEPSSMVGLDTHDGRVGFIANQRGSVGCLCPQPSEMELRGKRTRVSSSAGQTSNPERPAASRPVEALRVGTESTP